MKKTILYTAIAIAMSGAVSAQEAMIAQVGGVSVGATTPQPVNVTVSSVQAQVTPAAPTSVQLSTLFQDSALPAAATSGPVAMAHQTGSNHSAAIQQDGLNAAVLQQAGYGNTGLIQQYGGTQNRAAVIQNGTGGSALIAQNGSGNRALILQN
ncbi:hypothetical protein IV417_10455 [Alphaproteobacteria bacterium KMM 3653]|uniref:Curlin n=1 Tax=Harenicola maris TaxID=2841044 RepID=A0AAP2CQN8_9RHOB|nr:hypothetical protein [Harenicola maris]